MNIPEKLQVRTQLNIHTGCLEWMGALDHSTTKKPIVFAPEAPTTTRNGRTRPHRWLFHLNVQPIDKDTHLTRTCDNPNCVNPFHYKVKD